MRRLCLVAVAVVTWVSAAEGADYELPDPPILRGSTPYVPAPPVFRRWSGFYAGGQVGYGSAHMDFSGATRDLVQDMLRQLALESEHHVSEWKVLGSKDTGGPSIGGFIGYNTQWDDAVLGVDLHYGWSNFSATAPADPLGRRVTTSNGNTYDVLLNGSASMKIHDWGAARVRGGYVMGNLMPYATVGFAFGRADVTRSVSVDATETSPTDPPVVIPFGGESSQSRKNVWLYGWTAGGGIDFLIMPNVFVRAEYEYVSFAGVSGIKAAINTGRLGAGIRF